MAETSLQYKLNQQQVLSPQMRQGLEILQANSLELGQLIQQALQDNPVIEQQSNEESFETESTVETEELYTNNSDYDDDMRDYRIIENRGNSMIGSSEAVRDHFYNSIVAPQTLQQHLLEQLTESAYTKEIKYAGSIIIGALDDRGFLTESLTDIAQKNTASLSELENALSKIQHFTPAGVGAADVQESLLIQLHHKGLYSNVLGKVIEQHFSDLAYKRYPDIAKSLNLPLNTIVDAAEVINNLTPDPGSAYNPTHNPHITPDILISYGDDGKLQAELTSTHLPHLFISDYYKDLMSSTTDKDARNYLKSQIREGKGLINSISQRQITLLSIANVLIDKQAAFFSEGPQALKGLTMNEVAELIEVHPTTVSRAATSKYIKTPQGIYELRYFFTTGLENEVGSSVSSTSIRQQIQHLINTEERTAPLSDSAIEKILKDKGVKVARRTVAKYRDQLGILPSNLRKTF